MRDLLILVAHLLSTVARLLGPGGAKAVVADSLLMKHPLRVINRSRHRAPNFSTLASISTVPGSPNTRFPPYGERLGGEKHVIDLTTEFFMRRIQHPE